MIRVHVICEGQTEETFTHELLAPHFQAMNVDLRPSLVGNPGHKGGVVKFERVQRDIRNRLRGDKTAYCTTFFDFYGLDSVFPGKRLATGSTASKHRIVCMHLQKELSKSLDENALRRFIPYVQMHEFEALLFSDPQRLATGLYQETLREELETIRRAFGSPEDINDAQDSCPSARLTRLVSGYEKPTYGVLAALEIGLPAIRRECQLFDKWIKQLEQLSAQRADL
ncbi:MAG: DUF4276 family protein [Chloroflexi bacterium]|nr:DUF4276 family protein [Chloroflexota bacterium]